LRSGNRNPALQGGEKVIVSYDIIVSGIVQGVGFRPSVYRCAVKSSVKGYVRNLGSGDVLIHIEGDRDEISRFIACFFEDKPSPAALESMVVRESVPEEIPGFLH
jgi:hydrogenase maturation protein HypF